MSTAKTDRRVPFLISEFNAYINSTADYLGKNLCGSSAIETLRDSTVHIIEYKGPKGAQITLHNTSGTPGPVLNFCLKSANSDACMTASSVALDPGQSRATTMWNLGAADELIQLNVTNTDAGRDGHCMAELFKWSTLGLTETEWKRWKEFRSQWNELYKKYTSKKPSTKKGRVDTLLTDEMRILRENFAEFTRDILNAISGLRTATIEDLEALRIKAQQLRDIEPSPVHGSHIATGAPVVGLKNIGGGIIDVRVRRNSDQTRASMLKGFMIELRWKAGLPVPGVPDEIGLIAELSSKSRFQVLAGMENLGKTFFCYVRWRHKTNPAILSPWTNLLQITIA